MAEPPPEGASGAMAAAVAYQPLRCSEPPPAGPLQAEPEEVPTSSGFGLPACPRSSSSRTLWRTPLRLRLPAGAALALVCGGAAVFGRGGGHLTRAPVRGGVVVAKFAGMLGMGIQAYKELLGGSDPFEFHCPPAGLGLLVSAVENRTAQRDLCCRVYDSLGWPYQFPACASLERCSSCWRASASTPAELAAEHPAARFAGVAWASSLAVYSKPKPKLGWVASKLSAGLKGLLGGTLLGGGKIGDAELEGGPLLASVGVGLLDEDANLCPSISDWEQVMLNDEDDNIHARVLKSPSSKLAVVVFRGTQMTSLKNWQVDADLIRAALDLGDGVSAEVHEGFLASLDRVLPRVRKWVEGYVFHLFGAVPEDWTLLFTGHSLGGALAILAATLAEVQDWNRKPDMTVVFGAPRVGSEALGAWWRAKGLCPRLLRVNTYNDVIHLMPLKSELRWWSVAEDVIQCAADLPACLKRGSASLLAAGANETAFSDRWGHVCGKESEVLVPSAMKGVNEDLKEFSAIGGAMSHFIDNCLYGYSFGVLRSPLVAADGFCGISQQICR